MNIVLASNSTISLLYNLTSWKATNVYYLTLNTGALDTSMVEQCLHHVFTLRFIYKARALNDLMFHLKNQEEYYDGIVPNCNISIVNILEMLKFCTKPSIYIWHLFLKE